MIKRIITVIIISVLFAFPCNAKENDLYDKQYKEAVGDKILEGLPNDTKEFLEQNELIPDNSDWALNITPENAFSHIFSFLKKGIKAPLVSCFSILAIIIISSLVASNEMTPSVSRVTLYATVLSAAAVICVPVFLVVTATADTLKGCTVFMTSFIPIFAVVVASCGATTTAASMSALLLGATQVVNYVSNFVVVPLMSAYLSISIASRVSPLLEKSGIAEGIKKVSFWVMALLTTVFIGILSIQTAVGSSTDTLTVKTAKFFIGSAVPVAGTALSEALTTVTASVGLLKSSVGIYGVVASVVIFLPLIAELFLWRVGLNLTSAVSDLFSTSKISALLRSVDSVLSVLLGITLLTLSMFVISLAVVITLGRAQ